MAFNAKLLSLAKDTSKMNITFLGQGFEDSSPNSVGSKLISLFNAGSYHTFTAISAFISLAGVRGLAKLIEEDNSSFKQITVITGVDQQGTSKEALDLLLTLDIDSYVFYQPGVSIFHPKIYLFEGDDKSTLIIGSSNLTAQGLFVNVEASILIDIVHGNSEDDRLLKGVKDYYGGLYNKTDPNLQKLSDSLIQALVSAKIVPTEPERRKLYIKSNSVLTSRGAIDSLFPTRSLSKIPAVFKKAPTATAANPSTHVTSPASTPSVGSQTVVAATTSTSTTTSLGQLVWVRNRLPASSVQQSAAGTNPTGGLRLVQDGFVFGGSVIDQTTYFRNTVFGGYPWATVSTTPFVETTVVPFEITIRGINVGMFNLSIRHKPSGVAGQGNYTTSISWGGATTHIIAQNLTNARLELYSPVSVGNPFSIIIN